MTESGTTLRLRFAEFDRLTALRGWTTDAERARQLGISHAHLTNLRAGRTRAGLKLVRACNRVLGSALYDVLFEAAGEDVA